MGGSIKDRGNGTYQLMVSLGYDVKGKQRRAYKTIKCGSKKEAKKALSKFYLEIGNSSEIMNYDVTFEEFTAVFAQRHRKGISEVTWSHYEIMLRTRIIPCFGERKLSRIDTDDVLNFVDSIGSCPMTIDGQEKTLSRSSVLKYYKLLKMIFAKAVQWGYLGTSPCTKISRDMLPKSDVEHNPILSEEDLQRLLRLIDSHVETRDFLQNKLFFYVCLSTGVRRGEAGALCWTDVNLDKSELRISKALKTINGKTVGVGEPKTKSSNRIVFMDDNLKELFLRHRQSQRQWLKENGISNDSDLVFTSSNITEDRKTTLINPSSCYLWLQKLCRKNDIPPIGLHSLRAMCATLAASAGMPINLVSANLGHANLSTTSIYVRDMQEMRRNASKALFGKLTEIKKGK